MRRRFASVFLFFAVCSLTNGTAQATLLYKLTGVSVSANAGSGLIINCSTSTGSALTLPYLFSLNDGPSDRFSAFNIWTPETAYNPDDGITRAIPATLTFSEPPPGGSTVGASLLFGSNQYGQVTWSGPPR